MVTTHLERILGNDTLEHCLDVGARPGSLTKVLSRRWDATVGACGLVGTRDSDRVLGNTKRASREEQTELLSPLAIAKEAISSKHLPDGFKIGGNVGETASHTVPHLHVHLIPRYKNDVQDSRGGVLHVIPSSGPLS